MSNSTSTIHSVLSLGDVLSEIFSYSTQADNTSNARVCKVWCGHALNEIWHSATIVGLIALLSPVVKRRDATIMKYSRAIHADNWKRFDEYAWRVHCLCFTPTTYKYSDSIFSQIAHTRPRLHLLPNLTEMKLCGSHPPLVATLFGHASVRTLVLTSPALGTCVESIDSASAMFSYIPSQMMNLLEVRIEATIDQSLHLLHYPLCRALRGLPFLQVLHLPTALMTNDMVLSVSSLPNLRSIKMLSSTDPATFSSIPSNGFPSLALFWMTASISQATSWFLKPGFPKGLTNLSFTSHSSADSPTAEVHRDFIWMVVSNFKFLVHLSLSLTGDEYAPLPFNILEPILSLIGLQTLKLVHHHFTEVGKDDLFNLFESLPNLRLLHFRHRQNESKLPLTALAAISPVSPKLTDLSLDFTASLDVDVDLPDIVAPFPHLRRLDVGMSSVAAPVKAALFLSRVLPDGCTLHFASKGDLDWEKVQELLPAFTQVRQEERRFTLPSVQPKST